MNPRLGFFNVDTQQPSADRSRLVFRPRVAPIADRIGALLDHAAQQDIFVLSTTCVNAGPVEGSLTDDTLFVSVDAKPDSWRDRLPACRAAVLERRTCGSPEANIRARVFDIFTGNPNAEPLLRALGIEHWVVFGDSAAYCLRATAEGLLGMGFEVTTVADAVGRGTVSEEARVEILRALAKRGVTTVRTADVLAGSP